MSEHNELFIIAPQTLAALTPSEVDATIADLQTLGVCRMPYEKVDLQIAVMRGDEFKLPAGTDVSVLNEILEGKRYAVVVADRPTCIACRFVGATLDGKCDQILLELSPPKYRPQVLTNRVHTNDTARTIQQLCKALIVLLATRNAVKTTKENKLAKLGIGKRKHKDSQRNYARITTITLPEELEHDEEHPPTGRTVAAHLRRGHIRRQHYGPQRAFVKQVWIEPVFVNADKDFVSQRKAYNLSI